MPSAPPGEGLHHLVYEVVTTRWTRPGGPLRPDRGRLGTRHCVGKRQRRGIRRTFTPNGKSALETVLTAARRRQVGAGGYKVSGGLHGVGCPVNALSEWVQVTVHRQGQVHRQRFERGAAIGSLASEPQPSEEAGQTGTAVCFKPDLEIFTGGIVFDYATLSARLRELAYLNGGVRIVFRDERESARDEEGNPHEETYFTKAASKKMSPT